MKNTRKNITIKHLMFLSLTVYLYLGCVEKDTISNIQTVEKTKIVGEFSIEEKANLAEYGEYTHEIQKFLSATPLGSEIYLEQKASGEWYLKVEKTFTAKKDDKKIEIIEPIYGESILI